MHLLVCHSAEQLRGKEGEATVSIIQPPQPGKELLSEGANEDESIRGERKSQLPLSSLKAAPSLGFLNQPWEAGVGGKGVSRPACPARLLSSPSVQDAGEGSEELSWRARFSGRHQQGHTG